MHRLVPCFDCNAIHEAPRARVDRAFGDAFVTQIVPLTYHCMNNKLVMARANWRYAFKSVVNVSTIDQNVFNILKTFCFSEVILYKHFQYLTQNFNTSNVQNLYKY